MGLFKKAKSKTTVTEKVIMDSGEEKFQNIISQAPVLLLYFIVQIL
jgi:hypothetical protein